MTECGYLTVPFADGCQVGGAQRGRPESVEHLERPLPARADSAAQEPGPLGGEVGSAEQHTARTKRLSGTKYTPLLGPNSQDFGLQEFFSRV